MADLRQEVASLKKLLQDVRRTQMDLLLRVEGIEDRLSSIEGKAGVNVAEPVPPEPILRCVQCSADYRESENVSGACKYHSGRLDGRSGRFGRLVHEFSCCKKEFETVDAARKQEGCARGEHRSEHHQDYVYAEYGLYVKQRASMIKQLWCQTYVDDFVDGLYKWIEVGQLDDGQMFVLAGIGKYLRRLQFFGEYTSDKLISLGQTASPQVTVFDKVDDSGWQQSVSFVVRSSAITGIEMSVKTTSSPASTKHLGLVIDAGEPLRPGPINVVEDPCAVVKLPEYKVPEPTAEGPVLDPGEDFSVNRKNDYLFETSSSCPLQLKQHGTTAADSNLRSDKGKWNNLFTAEVQVVNTSSSELSVIDVKGHYLKGDEWVKCDGVFLGRSEHRSVAWLETPSFNMKPAETITINTRLCIKISGECPYGSSWEGRRAHLSLPQPLHLRATFIDHLSRKTSLRFEQGNKPLDLPTKETRTESWSKRSSHPMLVYVSADDTETSSRQDAAIYWDENGMVVARAGDAGQYFYIGETSSILREAVFKAKSTGEDVLELDSCRYDKKANKVRFFAFVDSKNSLAYGYKVAVTTSTSSATACCLVPQMNHLPKELSIVPEKLKPGEEFTISWSVPMAFPGDKLAVYSQYSIGSPLSGLYVYNTKAEAKGQATFKAPLTAGTYEVRYCQASGYSTNTGYRHDLCYMMKEIIVAAVSV